MKRLILPGILFAWCGTASAEGMYGCIYRGCLWDSMQTETAIKGVNLSLYAGAVRPLRRDGVVRFEGGPEIRLQRWIFSMGFSPGGTASELGGFPAHPNGTSGERKYPLVSFCAGFAAVRLFDVLLIPVVGMQGDHVFCGDIAGPRYSLDVRCASVDLEAGVYSVGARVNGDKLYRQDYWIALKYRLGIINTISL